MSATNLEIFINAQPFNPMRNSQRHLVVGGGIFALLERLKHSYRQSIRRKGQDASHDHVQKEAALSALRNALVRWKC